MRLLIALTAALSLALLVEAKPFLAVKVVPVPVVIPKVDILGVLGHVLGAKAALIGGTLKAKALVLHKVANIKHGLGALLSSSVPQGPTVYVTHSKPVAHEVVISEPVSSYSPPQQPPYSPPAPPPPSPPSSAYGAPSSTYGVP